MTRREKSPSDHFPGILGTRISSELSGFSLRLVHRDQNVNAREFQILDPIYTFKSPIVIHYGHYLVLPCALQLNRNEHEEEFEMTIF